MGPWGFYTFLIYFMITVIGLLLPLPFTLLPAIFIFMVIPIVDLLVGVDKSNPSTEQERAWRESQVWAPALYLYTLTHFMILAMGGWMVSNSESWPAVFCLALIVGLYTGGLGITVAHELCHKKEWLPKTVADLLLCSVWYQHFAVEHVRGHHLHVSTPEDPASARYNENVYSFLVRTIVGSFRHALTIDKKSVFKGVLISIIFTAIAGLVSLEMLVFFLAQALVAIVLLELVNYVEHYGLTRKQLNNGRYEKVLPIHSWNSAHKFSNLLLFNLQRHSDHHALAHLPYTVLKHQEDAPQLPSGYPGMILLALIPPIWFKKMNPKVDSWRKMSSTVA